MENNLEKVYGQVDRDLSSEWIELSSKVRAGISSLRTRSIGTALADDVGSIANDTTRLCDHLERIHRDVEKLLVELDEKLPEMDLEPVNVDPAEVQRESIQIHKETHELRADFKDIIKALFMWQDDPVERAKGKQ